MTHAQPPIQVITSDKGLTAWLVESHSIPMISVEVAFRAGSAWDPEGLHGLSSLTASLLDEGTQDKDAKTFKEALENLGTRFSARADKLDVTVSLDMLAEKGEESFSLLGEALRSPVFDASAVQRVKESMLASLKRGDESADVVASRAFAKALYGDHPYGTPTGGTPETVKALTQEAVQTYHQNQFHKANMVISVVGDITPEDLKKWMDQALGDLPAGSARNTIANVPEAPKAQVIKIEKDVPQASILMGHLGMDRHDEDYYATYMMNYMLGGGGFQSRLMQEVRVKRGLTYGIYSSFTPMPHKGSFVVKVQTNNADAHTSVRVTEEEIKKMQKAAVTEDVFADAVQYLKGSFPLRLDSNGKILGYLTAMQMEDLGLDYLETWTDKVDAVALEETWQAAKDRLMPEGLVTVIVGGKEAVQ